MNTSVDSLRFLRALMVSFALAIFSLNCMGQGNVGTLLNVEVVDNVANPLQAVQQHDLFSLQPGQSAKIGSFGAIDATGTTLAEDFDGDAIINTNEGVSNLWVADYPMIESSIAPPVTMEIVILKDSTGQANSITNNIASTDFETRRNEGSEKFHQDEVNRRTVQYTISKANSSSTQAQIGIGPVSFGGGKSNSHQVTKDVFEVKPFKNNIDRGASSVKNVAAEGNARKFRNEKRNKIDVNSVVESNAGNIRAALYIKNYSVNMPVKLSNILCSLLFETGTGELIPVQSFKLRNADYSIFSVEVYGGSEFGPYVIDLTGLNTVEIENAIAKGYTPKIFIVDYTMTHVADSNYKAALANTFTGNNLKIIEENAKGRTSLIKFVGPYLREMFRVAAFSVDTDTTLDGCTITGPATTVTPGISMARALQRIACTGTSVQLEHYVFDYTDTLLENDIPIFYTYTIKSVQGVANNFPCHSYIDGTDYNGNPATACLVRVADLTQVEAEQLGIWAFFDNGKFFDNGRIVKDTNGNVVTFNGTIPMVEGIYSTIWAGDNYDLVYLSMIDILGRQQEFGTNPFETYESLEMNSKWKKDDLGISPFYPAVNAIYLGEAGLGEQIEITVKLNETWKLLPSFGISQDFTNYLSYRDFTYSWQKESSYLFSLGEAFDFQIGFGLGGTRAYWYNISRIGSDTNSSNDGLISCGESWSFTNQEFTVCIQLPASLTGVGAGGIVSVHLRQTPNNTYREVIWPKSAGDVSRFQGPLFVAVLTGSNTIETVGGTGDITAGSAEAGTPLIMGSTTYNIASVSYNERLYAITLQNQTVSAYNANDTVTIGTFNGLIKRNTAAGVNVLHILPATTNDTLTTGSGQSLTVNIGVDSYTGTNVDLKSGIHTITLQSNLLEDHAKNEEVKIFSGLSASQVQYMEGTNFVTDWNGDPANAATANVPDYSTQLYAATISGCSYGLDMLNLLSPGCQGYSVDTTIANYLGAGGYENDWNDASSFNSYLTTMASPIATSLNGETLNVLPVPVNGVHSTLASQSPATALWGANTVVVWSESNGADQDIVGMIVDATGQVVEPKFAISTTNTNDQRYPNVAVWNNKAFVVWQSIETAEDIRGRIINLTNPTAVGYDFLINTYTTNSQKKPELVISDAGNSLVSWSSDMGGQWDIRARYYDMTTELPSTGVSGSDVADFILNTLTASNQVFPHIATYGTGNKDALIVWASNNSGVYDINGRFVDIDTETPYGADFYVANIANTQYYSDITISGSIALVVYDDLSPGNYDISGTFINLATQTVMTMGVGIANRTNSEMFPKIASSGKYAVVCWEGGNTVDDDIRCSVLDMYTQQLLRKDIDVSTMNSQQQDLPAVSILNDNAYIAWRSTESTGWAYRMQVIDLPTQMLLTTTDILLSDTIYSTAQDNTNYPENNTLSIINNGSSILTFWANDDGMFSQRLVPDTVFPLPYGINNFFTAPLVERSYSVRARLLY